ncbi:MAG: hypothetical protein WCI41_00590, partial [bacterium]
GNKEGNASISFDNQEMYSNDGLGTMLGSSSNLLAINVGNKIAPSIIKSTDTVPPQHFSIFLSNNSNMYDGKYFLLFETTDKESGVDHYEVKEGDLGWKEGASPYLLTNQPPTGTIYIKVFDKAGNTRVEKFTADVVVPEISIYSKLIKATSITVLILIIFGIVRFIKFIL